MMIRWAMKPVLLSTLTLASLPAAAGTPLPEGPHLVAAGEGKVSVKPDSARVRLSFEQRATSALPAKQKVDGSVNRLLDGLTPFAIADSDVRATELSATEDVDYDDNGKRVSRGFVAERNVTVLLKDVDRLNDFLDFALGTGATIGSIEFESAKADALRSEAKRKAIDDARSKARELAEAFGARLGPVYSVNSLNSGLEAGYGATTLDRIEVTGSRVRPGRYLQPSVDYRESVRAVFELQR
jgi:uncharacterized protein YggE